MSSYREIKAECYEANLLLLEYRLIDLTFGNVSVADHARGAFAIKPSGVDYRQMKPEDEPRGNRCRLRMGNGQRTEREKSRRKCISARNRGRNGPENPPAQFQSFFAVGSLGDNLYILLASKNPH